MAITMDKDIQALQKLIENDSDLRALSKFEDKINIFTIIKNGATEIRHSNVLAWLLQSHESHELGELFVREFIKIAIRNNPDKANLLDWAFLDYSAQIVQTEEKKIDITIKFESSKHIIAIENKTKSVEHEAAQSGKQQTSAYRERVEEDYANYTKLFVYLTPTGESPADGDWCILSYEDVLSIIEKILAQESLLPEVRLILSNYCSLVKSDVIGKDSELFNACNAVYQQHPEALDLLLRYSSKKYKNKRMSPEVEDLCGKVYALYENQLAMIWANREDPVAKLAATLFDLIKNTDGFELSKTAGKTYISFSSDVLDQHLPPLEANNGSWHSTNNYLFWFCTDRYKDENILRLAMELGGWNLPEATRANHNKIIAALKPKDNRPEYQYKIIRSKTFTLRKNASEETIRKVFDDGMDTVKQWIDDCIRALTESE